MDQYSLTAEHHGAAGASPERRSTGRVGATGILWWAVLLISAAANGASSLMGLHPVIAAAFGVVTVIAVVALVLRHLRGRAR